MKRLASRISGLTAREAQRKTKRAYSAHGAVALINLQIDAATCLGCSQVKVDMSILGEQYNAEMKSYFLGLGYMVREESSHLIIDWSE